MPRKCWSAIVLLGGVVLCAQDKPAPAPNPTALTGAQKQLLLKVDDDIKAQAGPVGLKLASAIKDFDRNILAEKPDAEIDRKLTKDLGDALAQVIEFRLRQVREIVQVLTPEQKKVLLAELDKPDANPDLVEMVKKVFADQKK